MTAPQAEEIIGCIDGTFVRVVADGEEIHLHFDGGICRLSRSGAALLAAALDPEALTPAPAQSPAQPPNLPPPGASRLMGTSVNPSVGDLIAEGYLDEGATLTLTRRGHEYTATVTAAGDIEHNGVLHGSLSAAAKAATGAIAMNGWAVWHAGDEGPIGNLRWWLQADHFPGEGHRYAESSAKEMQMVARWWVDHTLSKGLDPGIPNEAEVEVLLDGNDYAESTLESYRRHLRNWFALYGKNVAPSDSEGEPDDDSHAGML